MEKLIGFCNRITPANWNVTEDPLGLVFHGPGTLNIFIRVLDHFIDGWFYAYKKGPMIFYPVSNYKEQHRDARRSLQKFGDHLVAESEIWVYPDGCRFFGDDLYSTTVHELAHVAVDRWLAFRDKAHRAQGCVRRRNLEIHHGEAFCKAFEIFIQRVDRLNETSGKINGFLKSELENYRLNLAMGSPLQWKGYE